MKNPFRRRKKPSPPRLEDTVAPHERATVRADMLKAGLVNAIRTGQLSTIRMFLSRANIVGGGVAQIEDDREFLEQLKRMIRCRVDLSPLIPALDRILKSL